MFCPKCGNNIGEGSAFCTRCGYQVPQMMSQQAPQQAPQAAPQQQASQPDYFNWNNEPAPQAAPQQAPQAAPQQQASQPDYFNWNNEPAPQAAPQQAPQAAPQQQASQPDYFNWNNAPAPQQAPQQNYNTRGGGMAQQYVQPSMYNNTVYTAQPAKTPYFATGSKVAIIIFASLAMLWGIIGRAALGLDFGNVLVYSVLPTALLIVAAILMNKVPAVVAIAPVGYELILNLIDFIRNLGWNEAWDYTYYFVFLSFTVLFLLQLLLRKKIFKVFSVILAFLVLIMALIQPFIQFFEMLDWYDIEYLFEDMFDDEYIIWLISRLNYALFQNIAFVLFAFGVKSKD